MGKLREFDAIVIGSGGAGCAAAVYLGNAGKTTLMCTGGQPGGMLTTTDTVENYPAIKKISGDNLAMDFIEHAKVHAELCYEMVEKLIPQEKSVKVITEYGNEFVAKRVFIGTGSNYKTLGIPGEERLRTHGVCYCAICDGHFFRGKVMVVIGGGDSAIEAAGYLADLGEEVILALRGTKFRAKHINVQHLKKKQNIRILYEHRSKEIIGEKEVEAIVFDTPDGEKSIKCAAVFIAIGSYPNTKFLDNLVETKNGYIVVDEHRRTSNPLIYAGGDVVFTEHCFKQAVIAAADGCIAGLSIAKSIDQEE
jgi:thioredoxin reductase (NADPH)